MKLTKFEHSGVMVEKDGEVLLCDPVEFERKMPEFTDVVAVVLTHVHGDHFQKEVLKRIWEGNLGMKALVPVEMGEVVGEIAAEVGEDLQGNVMPVQAGMKAEVGGFALEFFGRDHAEIVPGKVPCGNIGVVIDGRIVNPGDSFDVPTGVENPEVLLVPIAAPWCKVAESMDYVRAMRPKMVIPVHDAVLSELGKGFNNAWVEKTVMEVGGEFVALGHGESVEV